MGCHVALRGNTLTVARAVQYIVGVNTTQLTQTTEDAMSFCALGVRMIATNWNKGQSQGVYQNVLPWERGSIGRYFTIQFGQRRIEFIFGAK